MAKLPYDPVKSPRHYTSGKVECIDAIESALGPEGFLAFLRGQVIKYQWRLGMKDQASQDAGKAQWYGDLLTRRLKAAEEKAARELKANRDAKAAARTAAKAAKVEVPTNLGEAQTDEKKEQSHVPQSTTVSSSTFPKLHYTGCSCSDCTALSKNFDPQP